MSFTPIPNPDDDPEPDPSAPNYVEGDLHAWHMRWAKAANAAREVELAKAKEAASRQPPRTAPTLDDRLYSFEHSNALFSQPAVRKLVAERGEPYPGIDDHSDTKDLNLAIQANLRSEPTWDTHLSLRARLCSELRIPPEEAGLLTLRRIARHLNGFEKIPAKGVGHEPPSPMKKTANDRAAIIRLAIAELAQGERKVAVIARKLGIPRTTLDSYTEFRKALDLARAADERERRHRRE